MKTIIFGDVHGRSFWKSVVHREKWDRIIFVGDYFDSHDDISAAVQMYNFKEIMDFKDANKDKVICLIGNHDHHYFPEIGDTGTSGYQHFSKSDITSIVNEYRYNLQLAYQDGEWLFTHAGVSSEFMDIVFGKGEWKVEDIASTLNAHFRVSPNFVQFNGRNGYGDDTWQTPIWIRPSSLMKVNRDTLREKVIQIVGHTGQNQIDIEGKSTGGRYYFIDTQGTSHECLVIEDGVVSALKMI